MLKYQITDKFQTLHLHRPSWYFWGGPSLPQTEKIFRPTCQLLVLLPIIQEFIVFLMSRLALLTLLCFGNVSACLHNLQICLHTVFKTSTLFQNSVPYSYVPIFWDMLLIFCSYLHHQERVKVLCEAGKSILHMTTDPQSDKVSHIS